MEPSDEVLACHREVLLARFAQQAKECELNFSNTIVRNLREVLKMRK